MHLSAKCLFLLTVTHVTIAFHTGAPVSICDSMKPGHPFEPQTGKSPFRIIIAKKEVAAGEPVEMTLTAPTAGPPFKGFLVEIHPINGDQPVGEFDPKSDENAQNLDCSGKTNSAMTHKDLTTKVLVKLRWTPPGEGEFKPVVTWVQQLDTFWVKETSDDTIKVTGGDGGASKLPGEATGGSKPNQEGGDAADSNKSSGDDSQNSAAFPTTYIAKWTSVISFFGTVFMHMPVFL